MKLLLIAASLHLALLSSAIAQNAKPAEIEITGTAIKAGKITPEEIGALPTHEQSVEFQTSKGQERGGSKGALLWSLLENRGIRDLPGHNAQLTHTFVVEGRDGYRIAFSVGEIDPDFGNAPMLIATERDGASIVPGEGYRLVVPGDKRGARYVRDVVKIEVQ